MTSVFLKEPSQSCRCKQTPLSIYPKTKCSSWNDVTRTLESLWFCDNGCGFENHRKFRDVIYGLMILLQICVFNMFKIVFEELKDGKETRHGKGYNNSWCEQWFSKKSWDENILFSWLGVVNKWCHVIKVKGVNYFLAFFHEEHFQVI